MQNARMLSLVAMLCLAACDGRPAARANESGSPTPSAAAGTTTGAERLDHSHVAPSASPTTGGAAVPADNAPLTKENENVAMPLPGQANDHSSKNLEPKSEPKGAKPR